MKEKGKIALLIVLLAVLVGLNLRRGREESPAVASENTPTAMEREESRIPDQRLRVDLLDRRVRRVTVGRNIFEYRVRAVPPPAVPPPQVTSPPAVEVVPPAPLRFYGIAENSQSGQKRVFLTDGEEIFIAVEGETVLRRYRVVHVGADSIELEDLVGGRRWVVPLEQP